MDQVKLSPQRNMQRFVREGIYDFGDGLGPVPAKRWPNGGGIVAESAVVDSTTWVFERGRVASHSSIGQNCKINGLVLGAIIEQKTHTRRGTVIHTGAWVGPHCKIRRGVKIASNVDIPSGCKIPANLEIAVSPQTISEEQASNFAYATAVKDANNTVDRKTLITDTHFIAGCQMHSFEKWAKFVDSRDSRRTQIQEHIQNGVPYAIEVTHMIWNHVLKVSQSGKREEAGFKPLDVEKIKKGFLNIISRFIDSDGNLTEVGEKAGTFEKVDIVKFKTMLLSLREAIETDVPLEL